MMISTKGRYALRVMIDLAEHNTDAYIPLKEIAERQDISLKYLESIMTMLSKAGFVSGLHGKGGGYKFLGEPANTTVLSILNVTEGSLAPVACLDCNPNTCERVSVCKTYPMWKRLYDLINDFFDGITIEDLVTNETAIDFVI